MSAPPPRRPQDMSEEQAEELRRAHYRLRKASQDLEGFTAPKSMRGRWEPAAVPDEAMDAARAELVAAYERVLSLNAEYLGWEPPGAAGSPPRAAGS